MKIFQRAVTLLVTVAFVLPLASYACSCEKIDLQESYDKAWHVFEANLVKNPEIIKLEKGTSHMPGSPYYAIYEFKPLKKWKGNPKVLKGLVSNKETADCGIKLLEDQRYLFFIYADWRKGYGLTADKLGLISACNSITQNNKALYSSAIKWLNKQYE